MPSQSETHGTRRVKYGLNVTIAITAAVLIVIIINAIGYKRLIRVRFDMTATRSWSLSDQTEKVVKNLKGDYRIVLLMSSGNEYIEQARDLIAEYGYLSGSLEIEEINPLNEARAEKFYTQLIERYEGEIAPLKQAIQTGREAMKAIADSTKEQLALLQPLFEAGTITDQQANQTIGRIVQFYVQYEQVAETGEKQIDEMLKGPLPNYNGAIAEVKTAINQNQQNAKQIIAMLTETANSKTAPTAVKDTLLRVVNVVKQSDEKMAAFAKQINDTKPAELYGKLRTQILASPEVAVILGPEGKQPRVVGIEEMFKTPVDDNLRQSQERPELRFLGEEKVTGALAAMNMDHQPMVVFVATGQQPAIGRGGQFEKVAQRMRNLNFDVREWSLSPKPNPMMGNQPMPPGPPPEPAKGQLAVWIVPPVQAQGNPFQQQPGGGDAQKVIEHITARLSEGDSVMVMTATSQMAMFGMPDAMAQFVENWGVSAQTDRIILREVVTQDRRKQPNPMTQVDQWPADSPLSPAMAGLSALFYQSAPLTINDDTGEARVTPLAYIRGNGLFAWSGSDASDRNATPHATEANSADEYLVAATIEMSGNRMMVVGNELWATDQVTTIAQGIGQPGFSPPFPAMFPGNTELFVNAVLWLAQQDDLIATSAASQDIRRIGEIAPGTMTALRWTLLVGMPLLTVIAGIGVYFVRRKG